MNITIHDLTGTCNIKKSFKTHLIRPKLDNQLLGSKYLLPNPHLDKLRACQMSAESRGEIFTSFQTIIMVLNQDLRVFVVYKPDSIEWPPGRTARPTKPRDDQVSLFKIYGAYS
jgi:hypothetical protein